MQNLIRFIILSGFLFPSIIGFTQEIQENYHFTYFGVNFSPIIPSNIIQRNDLSFSRDTISLQINQKPGYVFGMEVKHDFTRFIALQTGINFIQRNYEVIGSTVDSTHKSNLKFIGYEIPVLALGFVRLTKNIYADLSLGFCMNFFPSDLAIQHYYVQRYRWLQMSLLGNLGLEYRSENNGILYLGMLYQYKNNSMMTIYYYRDQIYGKSDMYGGVNGNYLALNLKYYFPQNPNKEKKKEK